MFVERKEKNKVSRKKKEKKRKGIVVQVERKFWQLQ